MSVLKKLLEDRAAAQAAYDEFVAPLLEAEEPLTDAQETQRTELRGSIETLDARIDEVHAREQREARLATVRTEAGLDAPTEDDADNDGTIAVTHEPTVYGQGSPNSYFADYIRAQSPIWPGHHAAVVRLEQASHEAAVELVQLEKAGTRDKRQKANKIGELLRNEHRKAEGTDARQALDQTRALGATGRGELRAMSTGAGSGGSFVTPVYFVQEYAPYRQFGRVFIDQCNKQTLPDYGITVYLPHLTGPAGVASQSENTAVTETDPTAGYLSNNLTTEAGQVTISQQLLDRAGPNFQFDVMVFDQLRRDYAKVVDTYAVNQALANAGSVTYNGTFAVTAVSSATSFYSKIGAAKVATQDAAGTHLPATHLFGIPDRWEYVEGSTDINARPLIVPAPAGPFASAAAVSGSGDPDAIAEGYTGYRIRRLHAFEDGNIPTVGTTPNDQVIVAHMPEVWIWEGDLVPRVIPQTYAQNLQVLLQVYAYITAIVRYPLAVQTITGTAMGPVSF